MYEKEISEYLSSAVGWIRRNIGIDCTLSEILYMRSCIIESLKAKKPEDFFSSNEPFFDSIAKLMQDYYGIEYIIWYRSPRGRNKGNIIVGRFSKLIEGDEGGMTTSHEFGEYMKREQEKLYLP